MKIAAIYTQSVGPLADGEVSFKNEWTGEIESNILLTGPNGCGKSTLLRAVAMLWEALGHWLDRRDYLPMKLECAKWLRRWEGVAVVMDDLQPICSGRVGLFFGTSQWCEQLTHKYPDVNWIGESFSSAKITLSKNVFSSTKALYTPNKDWIDTWSSVRKHMILTGEKSEAPNLIYLDAEERRWVAPKRRVSEPTPDVLSLRWLARYQVSDEWKGQLESSLINLKTTQLHKFHEVTRKLNEYLAGKEIETDIRPGEGRLRVKLKNQRSKYHFLDELSAGEHQVLIMLYMLQRWMQPGGVVLIDEPDLHLHPSLISPLLAAIENIVKDQNGQLVITSHATEIWQRYENLGMRVDLTHGKDVTNGQH